MYIPSDGRGKIDQVPVEWAGANLSPDLLITIKDLHPMASISYRRKCWSSVRHRVLKFLFRHLTPKVKSGPRFTYRLAFEKTPSSVNAKLHDLNCG